MTCQSDIHAQYVMPARYETSLIAINQQVDRVRLEHFGSGTLVRMDGHHFIISAAHVLTAQKLWLPGKPSIPLDEAGKIVSSAPFENHEAISDTLDSGYVLLAPHAVTALEALGRTFLDTNAIALSLPAYGRSVFVFSGMPCSSAETLVRAQTLIATPTFIRGEGLTDERLKVMGRNPNIHLGIQYDRERLREEGTGKRVTGPIPNGMSGGPVWIVLPDGTPLLVGIGTHYDWQKHVLLGTKIQPLLTQIFESHFSS